VWVWVLSEEAMYPLLVSVAKWKLAYSAQKGRNEGQKNTMVVHKGDEGGSGDGMVCCSGF